MEIQLINALHSQFEQAAHEDNAVTYWLAREIQLLLEYDRWENFERVVERSIIACENSGHVATDHFREVTKMVDIGSGSQRRITDVMLTRYACYLIAQNGDSRKEAIAFAQSYFAVQTRKQELLEERLKLVERMEARAKLTETEKQLSSTLYQHGVDDKGFALIRSKGDAALFGGRTTQEMKAKFDIKSSRALADFLPTVTLKAKEFAAAITDFNVRKHDLRGVPPIAQEHVKNNNDVRAVLAKSDIRPESLPPEEDIKKLQRRVRSADQKSLNIAEHKEKLSMISE